MFANSIETPPRILVVDDEPDVLEMTLRVLSGAGYDVIGATGHAEFMASFDRVLPNLAVIDLRMPEHDGFWIAERVKAVCDIPIIFMTACHCAKYELYAPIAGAASYINKPFEPELLLGEVKKALAVTERRFDNESPQLPSRSRHPIVSGAALTSE